jgi:hypothetical protein
MFTDGADGTSQIISGSLELDGKEGAIYRWHYRYLSSGKADTLQPAQDTMRFQVSGNTFILYRFISAGPDSPDSVLDADSGRLAGSTILLRESGLLERGTFSHELRFERQ